ncbi:MAG: hypothetical protein NZ742_10530 [Acidobacteria bacterium]|nr:hypothetical protein [Acidobacteriota bacterium]MDW7985168.1 hypothetical protein [Acidobacteriota bacterium]
MRVRLGKVFRGIGKALSSISRSLFRGKLFGILGKLIPGLNLTRILGSVFKVLGSAQRVQNFLQVGRQVFEALRGKHRIDDRVQNLPAPIHPPVNRSSTPPPSSSSALQKLVARVDSEEFRRILDGILNGVRPWLRPTPDRSMIDTGPAWIDPSLKAEAVPLASSPSQTPDWVRSILDKFQEHPFLAPFSPFPIENPAVAAAHIGPVLRDFAQELMQRLGLPMSPTQSHHSVIIR